MRALSGKVLKNNDKINYLCEHPFESNNWAQGTMRGDFKRHGVKICTLFITTK